MDSRLEQAISIIKSIIIKTLIHYSEFAITTDNNLIIICDSTLLYEIPLKGFIQYQYPDIIFKIPEIDKVDLNSGYGINIIDINYSNIFNTYNLLKNAELNCPLVAHEKDIHENENFKELLDLKSKDGMHFYRMSSIDFNKIYMIPMFSGFISIAKSDKLDLSLYDTLDRNLIIVMNMYKKKISSNFKVYCKIINI